ncbi:MAG: hypothetical protein V4466_02040 [Pseudomonadota bacterium]
MEYPPMAVVGVLGAGFGALGSILNRGLAILESREAGRLMTASAATPSREAVWPWVAAVRALIRPVLTLMLWLLLTGLFLTALLGGLEREMAARVIATVLDTVAFAASTAMAWWFADRAPRRG